MSYSLLFPPNLLHLPAAFRSSGSLDEDQERLQASVEEEILIMSRLSHRNIVRMYGSARYWGHRRWRLLLFQVWCATEVLLASCWP